MKTISQEVHCESLEMANQAKKFFESGEGVAPMNAQHLKHFRTPGAVITGKVVGKNRDGSVLLVLTKTWKQRYGQGGKRQCLQRSVFVRDHWGRSAGFLRSAFCVRSWLASEN
jgi:hypothetical protein